MRGGCMVFQHTVGILFRPEVEWRAIRDHERSFLQVFVTHVPFLALIPVVCAYYGVTEVGWRVADGNLVRLTGASALALCALTYVALLSSIFLLGEFINWMSKTYGVTGTPERRHYESMALAVYASAPFLLAGIANLYPQLWLVASVMGLAGCYAVYLMYRGIPILMNIHEDRAFMYVSSVVTVALVLMVSTMIVTVVVWGMGIGPIYTS